MLKKIRFLFMAGVLGLMQSSPVSAAVAIGEQAPDFKLPAASGTEYSLADFKGKFVVLEWINPDCPFVKKHYGPGNMQGLQETYTAQGVTWLSIASSAPGLQGHYDAAAWQTLTRKQTAHPTAVLLDPAGAVGKLYGAKTTPHMFVIDPQGEVIYAGAIDSTPSPHSDDIAKSENFVAKALDEAMKGHEVSTPSTKAYGCSVKYAS